MHALAQEIVIIQSLKQNAYMAFDQLCNNYLNKIYLYNNNYLGKTYLDKIYLECKVS